MANVTLKLGPQYKQLKAALARAPKVIADAVEKGVAEALGHGRTEGVVGVLQQEFTNFLNVRSGRLRTAITSYEDITNRFVGFVGVGSNQGVEKYAWQLGDETKTITPSKKFLAIPIADNLTGAGVARFSSPLQVDDGCFFTSKKGNLLFARKQGDDMQLLFAMKESVTITGFGSLPRVLNASVVKITKHIHTVAVAALRRIGL